MATPPQEVESGLAAYTSQPPRDYTDFAEIWPSVFSTTVQRLVARGVPPAVAEDAAQEAGTRALTAHISFTDAGDLTRWISTVAWRLAVDEHRRHARRVVTMTVADHPSDDDVATTVEARVELRLVRLAWRRLSPTDRALLVAPHPETSDRRSAVRAAVRRHRARNRLVALIEGLGALALILLSRLRRPAAAVAAMGAVPLAAAVLVHIGDGDVGSAHRGPDGARRPHAAITTTVGAVDGSRRVRPVHPPAAGTAGDQKGGGREPSARAPQGDEPQPPLIDAGVDAEVRPRDTRDDTLICVRLPAGPSDGERCVESTGDDIELSRLDDGLD